LLANAAYIQATLMWFVLTPFLYKFNRYCTTRFGKAVRNMPLETAADAPPATVDPAVYLPPALRFECLSFADMDGTSLLQTFMLKAHSWPTSKHA
jgi:hypothetical protein